MKMYQRGDVVIVPFPFTNLATSKRRPALTISNNLVNNTGDLIIVMITSHNKNDSLQIEMDNAGILPKLPKPSFLRCHRITAIDSNLILGVIGKEISGKQNI